MHHDRTSSDRKRNETDLQDVSVKPAHVAGRRLLNIDRTRELAGFPASLRGASVAACLIGPDSPFRTPRSRRCASRSRRCSSTSIGFASGSRRGATSRPTHSFGSRSTPTRNCWHWGWNSTTQAVPAVSGGRMRSEPDRGRAFPAALRPATIPLACRRR